MASKVIGGMTVTIAANTAKLQKGLKDSRKHVSKFTSTVRDMSSVVKKAIGVGVVGSFAAMAKGIYTATQEMDRLIKVSDKLGIVVGRLVELQHAAKLTGVGVSTFNMAMQRMVRRISEAGKGQGESVKALKELGLDAARLAKSSPDKAFLAVAQAMSKVQNSSDKLRLAFKLFDSEGVELVRMLNLGSVGLRRLAKDANDLNLVFSADIAKKFEEMNNSLSNVINAWVGLMRSLASEWSSTMVFIAKASEGMSRGIAKAVGPSEDSFIVRMMRDASLYATLEQKRGQDLDSKLNKRNKSTGYDVLKQPLTFDRQRLIKEIIASDAKKTKRFSDTKLSIGSKVGNTISSAIKMMSEFNKTAGLMGFRKSITSGVSNAASGGISGMLSGLRTGGDKLMGMQSGAMIKAMMYMLRGGANGTGGSKTQGLNKSRSSLAFTEAGTPAFFRQQARIKRQGEGEKLDKNRNKLLEDIKKAVIGTAAPAVDI